MLWWNAKRYVIKAFVVCSIRFAEASYPVCFSFLPVNSSGLKYCTYFQHQPHSLAISDELYELSGAKTSNVTGCIGSYRKTKKDVELEGIRKEAILVYFKTLSEHIWKRKGESHQIRKNSRSRFEPRRSVETLGRLRPQVNEVTLSCVSILRIKFTLIF
jgi:hypothetical protein